jgi:hypothetical protein
MLILVLQGILSICIALKSLQRSSCAVFKRLQSLQLIEEVHRDPAAAHKGTEARYAAQTVAEAANDRMRECLTLNLVDCDGKCRHERELLQLTVIDLFALRRSLLNSFQFSRLRISLS